MNFFQIDLHQLSFMQTFSQFSLVLEKTQKKVLFHNHKILVGMSTYYETLCLQDQLN